MRASTFTPARSIRRTGSGATATVTTRSSVATARLRVGVRPGKRVIMVLRFNGLCILHAGIDASRSCIKSDPRVVEPGRRSDLARMGTSDQAECWRIEHAERAAVLIDAGAFFGAVRAALLQAQRTVFIIGWDLDSRTRLVGEDCAAHDGWPVTLREFLVRLVRRAARPDRAICSPGISPCSTRWSASRFPRSSSAGTRPRASASGSTMRCRSAPRITRRSSWSTTRWRSPAGSISPSGAGTPAGTTSTIRIAAIRRAQPYRPFHDVQMMVDGAAARALGRDRARALGARDRRRSRRPRARGRFRADGAPWPRRDAGLHRCGRSRSRARCREYEGQQEVREVEALFPDMIARAERTIYIENQFLTCSPIAKALAQRMQREARARSRDGRAAHARHLAREPHHAQRPHPLPAHPAGERASASRVRLLCPEVRHGRAHHPHHGAFQGDDRRRLRCCASARPTSTTARWAPTPNAISRSRRSNAPSSGATSRRSARASLADHCGVSEQEAAAAIATGGR